MADPCKNSVVNEQVYDSVAAANFKVVAEGVAHRSALVQSNDVYDQQAQRTAERKSTERMEYDYAEQRAAARRANERAEAAHYDALASARALQTATLAAAVKSLLSVTPEQAVDDSKVLTGDDMSAKIANLLAAIATGGIAGKQADTQPPQTGSEAGSSASPATK